MDPVQETQARWLLKSAMQWEIYYPDNLSSNPVNVAELEKHVTITSGAVWVTKMREYFEPIVTKEKQMKLKIGEELPLKVLERWEATGQFPADEEIVKQIEAKHKRQHNTSVMQFCMLGQSDPNHEWLEKFCSSAETVRALMATMDLEAEDAAEDARRAAQYCVPITAEAPSSTAAATSSTSAAPAAGSFRANPAIIPDDPEEHGGLVKNLRKKDCGSDEYRVRHGMWIPEKRGGGVAWATDSDMASFTLHWLSRKSDWGGNYISRDSNFPLVAIQFNQDDEWEDFEVYEAGKQKKPYWHLRRCMTVTLNSGVGPMADLIQIYLDKTE